jgi:hypothetical protein
VDWYSWGSEAIEKSKKEGITLEFTTHKKTNQYSYLLVTLLAIGAMYASKLDTNYQ